MHVSHKHTYTRSWPKGFVHDARLSYVLNGCHKECFCKGGVQCRSFHIHLQYSNSHNNSARRLTTMSKKCRLIEIKIEIEIAGNESDNSRAYHHQSNPGNIIC